jgi:hypothetical protein
MTSRLNRELWWIALAAAFVAVPVGAAAETPTGKQGQRGDRGARAERQAQGAARAEGANAGAEQADESAPSYTSMNASFAFPLSNRCMYTATIGGVVATAEAWDASDKAANLRPNVTIEAAIDCPNATRVSKTNTFAPEAPISRAEFEAELERRARITASDYAGRCVYAPDFVLTDNFFANRHVTYLCSLDWAAANR